jgi:serine/threonine protein phosphatase PrpC
MIRFNNFFNQTRRSELRLETFGMSEVGRHKTSNEDAFLIADINAEHKLLAVADGFSRSFGDEASRLAVNELRETLRLSSNWSVPQRLEKAIEIASRKIETHFDKIHHSKSVGTTLTAIYVAGNTAYVAHVGNSRAYLVRDGKVKQLTTDHTFAQILADSGVEPGAAAQKTLLQAVGVDCELAPMLVQTELLPDDYLLLCSDGFSNNLDSAEIARAIEENADVSVAAQRLVETANERDGNDNITLILAHVCRTNAAAKSFATVSPQPFAMRMAA